MSNCDSKNGHKAAYKAALAPWPESAAEFQDDAATLRQIVLGTRSISLNFLLKSETLSKRRTLRAVLVLLLEGSLEIHAPSRFRAPSEQALLRGRKKHQISTT